MSYIWQKVHEALRGLISTNDDRAVQEAFALIGLAESQQVPSDVQGQVLWKKIRELKAKGVEGLSAADRRELGEALWELHGILSRE